MFLDNSLDDEFAIHVSSAVLKDNLKHKPQFWRRFQKMQLELQVWHKYSENGRQHMAINESVSLDNRKSKRTPGLAPII